MTMRILVMTDTPENPDSGAAGTEYRTIEALRRLGHEVDAVWSPPLPRRIAHGNFHYLLELPLNYRTCMLDHLTRTPYDVIHASQPHGWLAARAARRHVARPVFVHRSHGFEPRVEEALRPWRALEPRRAWPKRFASAAMAGLLGFNHRAIARYANGHIVSAALCRDMLQRFGVPQRHIAVIAQAPPAAFQHWPVTPFEEGRADRILHVGQYAFFKAPAVLAEAFELVLRERPQASLTWVCPAAHHRQAHALFGPLGRDRVTFVDWMPQQELIDLYDRHGVFLFPSYFEGFGKVFLEAMSRGQVVVASNEGGARDVITRGVDGFVVPVGDAASMAKACLHVQRHPNEARAISSRARETALQYTWDRVARETAQFYESLRETL